MYRIDDNTFIDTSLITCAEYQLFIDDMRVRGEYFQPDHWDTYQFPKGHAQLPILGVRPTDAMAFCNWLSIREHDEWQYRIPTPEEAVSYPINLVSPTPLGYWTFSRTNSHSFFWVSQSEKFVSPLNLDLERAVDQVRESVPSIIFSSNHNLDRSVTREFINTLNQTRKRDFEKNVVISLDRSYQSERSHPLAVAILQTLAHIPDLNFEVDFYLHHAFDLLTDLFHARNRVLNRLKYKGKNFSSNYGIDEIKNSILLFDYLNTAINLLILQLRRRNLYPPLEGLRIVKEQIPNKQQLLRN